MLFSTNSYILKSTCFRGVYICLYKILFTPPKAIFYYSSCMSVCLPMGLSVGTSAARRPAPLSVCINAICYRLPNTNSLVHILSGPVETPQTTINISLPNYSNHFRPLHTHLHCPNDDMG